MSTIRHPVQNHSWWYAAVAAVVVAGLLAVLLATVVSQSRSVDTQAYHRPAPRPLHGHAAPYGSPCFASRPGASIELTRSACWVGTP